MNTDIYLKSASYQRDVSVVSTCIQEATQDLLSLALISVLSGYFPPPLRSQIDRTAIITQNKQAMLASVMNPIPIPRRRDEKPISSILPYLARAYPGAMEVEALLRPQMPPIESRQNDDGDTETDKDQDAYMHDYAANGGIYKSNHDPKGTNGDATVKANTAFEPSDAQFRATYRAVEDDSPRVQSSTVFPKAPTPTSTILGPQSTTFSSQPLPQK